MPSTKHAITLNLTGNASKELLRLMKMLEKSGKTVGGVFSGAERSAKRTRIEVEKTEREQEKVARKSTRDQELRDVKKITRGVFAGEMYKKGVEQAIEFGKHVFAGGTAMGGAGILGGAAGSAMMGYGAMVGGKRGAAYTGAGLAVSTVSKVAGFMGQMSEASEEVLRDYTKVAALTTTFNEEDRRWRIKRKGVSAAMGYTEEVGRQYGVRPSDIRAISTVIAKQTGTSDRSTAASIAKLSVALGGEVDEFANYVAYQKRFNQGVSLKEVTALGIASGLKKGQLGEFLQGTQNLQEQLLQQGVIDKGEVSKVLTEFGNIGKTFQGKYGADVVSSINQIIMGSARGGGGLASNLGFAALQRFNPDMGYYDIIKELEKGVAGKGFDQVIKMIREMGGTKQSKAQLLSEAYGLTQTRAEEILAKKQTITEERAAEGRATVDEALKSYETSDYFSKQRSEVAKIAVKELAELTASGVESGVMKGIDRFMDFMTNRDEKMKRKQDMPEVNLNVSINDKKIATGNSKTGKSK